MEGGNGPYTLDLVNMAPRLGQRLAQQRLRRAVAEQQEPLGAGKLDVLASNLGARLAVSGTHARSGTVKAGKGRTVGILGLDADRSEHALCQLPCRPANRLTGGRIFDPQKPGNNEDPYKAKITLQNGGQDLIVRGYMGFSWIGRSQTWHRAK